MNCRLILTEFRQCLGILIVLGDKVLTTTMRFISAPLFFLQTRASSCCLTPFLAVSFSYIGLSGCIYHHDLFFSFFPYPVFNIFPLHIRRRELSLAVVLLFQLLSLYLHRSCCIYQHNLFLVPFQGRPGPIGSAGPKGERGKKVVNSP